MTVRWTARDTTASDALATRAIRPARVLLSVGIASFMSALDGSVVNALLPVIRGSLHATVAGIQWVVTVYLLVVSGLLLAFGRLGDLHGHRQVYLWGFAGFIAASALCGVAPSDAWLIAFRGLQGVAGAMLLANSPAILVATFPATKRGRALGLQATMTYLGLSAGPVLGGLLAGHFGWRSIFLINVPIGCAGFVLSRRSIARDEPRHDAAGFDWAGAGLFVAGLSALLIALNQGHAWGWSAPRTLATLGLGAVVIAVFVRRERREPHPMLDPSLFRSRTFAMSVLSAMASYVAIYSVLFVLPFYLIQGRGMSPQHAGLVLSVQPLVMMIAAPLAGSLSDRLGARIPTVLGLATLTVGLLLLSWLDARTAFSRVAIALGVCGIGLGSFIAPNNSRLLGAAPPSRRGIASGVLAAARTTGMMAGVALSGAVYTTVLARSGPAAIPQGVSAALLAAAAIALLGVVASTVEHDAPP